LNDYITASQDGIEAMQAGQDLKPYNDKMSESRQRILDNLKN
jgi:hypothetical protein